MENSDQPNTTTSIEDKGITRRKNMMCNNFHLTTSEVDDNNLTDKETSQDSQKRRIQNQEITIHLYTNISNIEEYLTVK